MKDVSIKLYKDDRHEILNETDRYQVYEDLYRWMNQRFQIEKVTAILWSRRGYFFENSKVFCQNKDINKALLIVGQSKFNKLQKSNRNPLVEGGYFFIADTKKREVNI